MKMVELTEEQEREGKKIFAELERTGEAVLAGAAGTGKTTLFQWLKGEISAKKLRTVQLAPTGKAAARIREVTGEDAFTIHSRLFSKVFIDAKGEPHFNENDSRPPCEPGDILLVDEASMIDEFVYRTIRKRLPRDARIVFSGDHCQLPPVAGKFGPNLEHPSGLLETVHRQALDSPILRYATDVRNGGKLPVTDSGDGQYRRGPVSSIMDVCEWLIEARRRSEDAQIVVWDNKLRQRINAAARMMLGWRKEKLVEGDQLVMLQNNPDIGRFNGEVVTVKSVTSARSPVDDDWDRFAGPVDARCVRVRTTEDDVFFVDPESIGIDKTEFAKNKALLRTVPKRQVAYVDYAQALTIHKMQGSQAETVGLVIDEKWRWAASKGNLISPDMNRRMLYTAATRAKKNLRVFDLKG